MAGLIIQLNTIGIQYLPESDFPISKNMNISKNDFNIFINIAKFFEGINSITLALYTLIATGIGVIVAMIFNIKAVRQSSKTQKYQMIKDFFKEFHEIQKMPSRNPSTYIVKVSNFTQMVLDLHKSGIVEKEMITENLTLLFTEACWFHKTAKGKITQEMKDFDQWCKANKIEPQPPVDFRTKVMSEITFDDSGVWFCHYKPIQEKIKSENIKQETEKKD